VWGLESLRDLPDMDRLEEAGLIGHVPVADDLRSALGITDETEASDEGPDDAIDQYEDVLSEE
jgi:hypothetical protein